MREREEDRTSTILAAARQVFGEYGYHQATMQEVARRAGVAKGTVYLYFSSKEELYEAVVYQVVQDYFSGVEQYLDCRFPPGEREVVAQRLKSLARFHISFTQEHLDLVHGSQMQHVSQVLQKHITAVYQRYHQMFARFLHHAYELEEEEAARLSLAFEGILSGFITRTIAPRLMNGEPGGDATDMGRQVKDADIDWMVEFFLRGLENSI